MGLDFNSLGFGGGSNFATQTTEEIDDVVEGKKAKRRTKECTELSLRYEYRRAFSEIKLLESMEYIRLQNGHSYNFITAGDVDSLSYLKIVLNQHKLDYALCSTWCMAAEDILQLQNWYIEERIKKIDLYVGEIFFYAENPEAGRVAVFKNHSKIYAGCNEDDDFYFGIQTSANINTNPRTEQGCITVDRGIFEFYKEYFDGIKSFEK